jgi:hypothetical protein
MSPGRSAHPIRLLRQLCKNLNQKHFFKNSYKIFFQKRNIFYSFPFQSISTSARHGRIELLNFPGIDMFFNAWAAIQVVGEFFFQEENIKGGRRKIGGNRSSEQMKPLHSFDLVASYTSSCLFFLFQCVHVYNSRNMCVCALRWAIPAQTV